MVKIVIYCCPKADTFLIEMSARSYYSLFTAVSHETKHGTFYVIIPKTLHKRSSQKNSFLISPQKHMLWVLIRSASPRHF